MHGVFTPVTLTPAFCHASPDSRIRARLHGWSCGEMCMQVRSTFRHVHPMLEPNRTEWHKIQ
jgi:hypothetical protein